MLRPFSTTRICVLAAALLVVTPASATQSLTGFDSCRTPSFCEIPEEVGQIPADYTLFPDGKFHIWHFRVLGDDPNAILSIPPPNQTESEITFRTASGFEKTLIDTTDYIFKQLGGTNLDFRIGFFVREAFDTCGPATPIGAVCARSDRIWNNGPPLTLTANAPMRFTFTELEFELVPEPAGWAMIIAGLGLVGAITRRRRMALRHIGANAKS